MFILSSVVFAHEEGEAEEIMKEAPLHEKIRSSSLAFIYITTFIVALMVIYSIYASKRPHFTEGKKIFLFLGIIVPVLITTTYLVSATMYLNSVSHTGGPVHWHADYEVYACGNKVYVIEPTGFSNKVGTEVFHQHGDNRIHVEGVVVDPADVDLHMFFKAIGGELSKDHMMVPTNEYVASYKNGDKCNGDTGVLQAFLYKTIDGKVMQEKLENFPDYILSPEALVPPGDCIIIEFNKEKANTKHICETYKIAISKGEVSYGG